MCDEDHIPKTTISFVDKKEMWKLGTGDLDEFERKEEGRGNILRRNRSKQAEKLKD